MPRGREYSSTTRLLGWAKEYDAGVVSDAEFAGGKRVKATMRQIPSRPPPIDMWPEVKLGVSKD